MKIGNRRGRKDLPELPEVETMRKSLVELVGGKAIESVTVRVPKIIKKPLETEQFQDALIEQTIHDVDRIGKFLIFLLDDYSFVSHLRMEGNYRLVSKGTELDKHDHIIFHFTDETELRYRDVRKFGTMHLFKKGDERKELPLLKLGPEPFSEDFTVEYFTQRLQKTSRIIKAVLLDQTIVTGLGNIYVDEVLYQAKVHPNRRANELKRDEIEKIRKYSADILTASIEAGGSSVNTYMNSHGQTGTYQEKLKVYGKTNEPCEVCLTPIEKIQLAGRGTHFCPNCQKDM